MDIQDIDVGRLELLERIVDRVKERLGAIATVVGDEFVLFVLVLQRPVEVVIAREFGGENDFVSMFSRTEPFAEPDLGFFILVLVCCVDEIATEVVVTIKYRECSFLVTFS